MQAFGGGGHTFLKEKNLNSKWYQEPLSFEGFSYFAKFEQVFIIEAFLKNIEKLTAGIIDNLTCLPHSSILNESFDWVLIEV